MCSIVSLSVSHLRDLTPPRNISMATYIFTLDFVWPPCHADTFCLWIARCKLLDLHGFDLGRKSPSESISEAAE
jgi:hypothetical protein